jgi:hypothetical protein
MKRRTKRTKKVLIDRALLEKAKRTIEMQKEIIERQQRFLDAAWGVDKVVEPKPEPKEWVN